MRGLATVIGVLALVNILLALGLWSTITTGMVSPFASESAPAPTPAVHRLGELLASLAFRSLITNDYSTLNGLIKQSATWPEVVHVSVEDTQGRILANTDAQRVGQIWSDHINEELRRKVNVPYEDVVVDILNPADNTTGTRMGRVRLGYLVKSSPVAAQPSRPPGPLWVVLGLAALAAVPTGLVVVKLAAISKPAAMSKRRSRVTREAEHPDDANSSAVTAGRGSEERAR